MKKEEAHKLIDLLPPKATWDDLMHEIYVRETIERGLADSNAGRYKNEWDSLMSKFSTKVDPSR